MHRLQVMSKYNLLFQYLLRLKRVGLGLEEAWGVLRRGQGGATANGAAPLWHVRHHMAHMINNLQIYVQVRLSGPRCFLHSTYITLLEINGIGCWSFPK
jgi:hypothetical protein